MNENERAEQFTRDVDALLRGETPAATDADDRALLDLARDLIAADFSAETQLDELRPQIVTADRKGKPPMTRRQRALRAVLAIAAALALMTAAVLTIPPLRALAQDILARIGIITVTDAPTYYEIRSQTPIPAIVLAEHDDGVWYPVSSEEVKGNFAWLAILEEMPEGYDMVEYGGASYPEQALSVAVTKYSRAGDPDTVLSLNQMERMEWQAGIDYASAGAQTENVSVNGNPGMWVAGFIEYPDLNVQMLIWDVERNQERPYDLTIWLKGHGMTKDEMLEIADSVIVRDFRDILQNTTSSKFVPNQVDVPLTQLAVEVGIPIAMPHFVPDLLRLDSRSTFVGEKTNEVFTWYRTGSRQLSMRQIKPNDETAAAWEIPIGNAPAEEVTVNGYPGVWVEDYRGFSDRPEDILIWEQDGFTFWIHAHDIERDDVFATAESIEYFGENAPLRDYEPKLLSAWNVSALTRFSIAVPEYVPPGYELATRDAWLRSDVVSANTTYVHPDTQDVLALQEARYLEPITPHELAAGDALIEDVTVNGRAGIWVANYQSYPDVSIRMLIWERGRYIYRLQSAALDKEVMLRIAVSLVRFAEAGR